MLEKQLLAWGEMFRAGKKFRVDFSFNYMEVGPQSVAAFSFQGTELIGLGAAEADKQGGYVPSAITRVFWLSRIVFVSSRPL
jgi:amino acid permease